MSAPTVVQKKSRTKTRPVVRTSFVAKNIPAKARPDPGIHAILNGTVQAKVQVGEPNDKYEKEADAVADKVMRMPEPKEEEPDKGVQRQAEVNEDKQEEETAQRAEIEEEKQEPEAQRAEVEEEKQEPEAQRAEVEEEKQEPEAQRAEVEEEQQEPEAQRAEVEEDKEEPEAQRAEVEEEKQEPEAQRAEVEEEKEEPEAQRAEIEEEQDKPEVQRQAEEGQQAVPAAAGGETAAAAEPTATGEGGGADEGETTEEEPWPEPTPEELESLSKAQRKASSTRGGNVDDPSVAQRINQPATGRPLSSGVRDYIEPRMGYDFSDVRVHDSPQDQADASAIRARAFTYGNHIWVGSNESADDKHLMAHELTHVVQQGDKAQRKLRRKAVVQQRTAGRKVQGGWWDRVTSAVSSAINAVSDLAGAALDAVLSRIAGWAENIPGFHLVTVILGKNPITDEVVERNATNVVRGVVGLIPGGEQFFQNLQESGALERAFNWLSTEIDRLNITWSYIKGLFRRAWDALELSDVMNPRRAFDKVARIFGPPLGRLLRFARNVGSKIMEFIVEGILTVMGPFGQQIMSILRRAQSVFTRILDDPIGFLRNLINAVKMGFNLFKTNIVAHLRAGLMGWLFGALQGAGLQIPEHFDLKGLISIVLQVLGLTYANLRRRLVRVLGERRVSAIERAVEIIRVIMTEGLAGAWRMILEYVGNLQSMVMGAIQNFVVTRIVQSAISYAISLFNPAGWVISAIRTIYNVVMFFVERWQQITALVNSVINSLDNIASGNIGPAAQYVEQTMARTLPVIISFLARLVGLGGISGHIRRFIQRVQRPVNRALDRIQAFIVRQARRLLSRMRGGTRGAQQDVSNMTPEQRKAAAKAALETELNNGLSGQDLDRRLPTLKNQFQLRDVRINRSNPHRPVIEYIASPAITTVLYTPEGAIQRAASGGSTSMSYSGNSSQLTPYGAIKAVYGNDTKTSEFRMTDERWQRPSRASATILGSPGSTSRNDVIGKSGRVGKDEHFIRQNARPNYHGGHLVGLQLVGVDTNDSRNLAPQIGSFNSGTYLQLENWVKNSPINSTTGQKDSPPTVPLNLDVTVSYPSSSFQVSHQTLVSRNLVKPSAPDPGHAISIPTRIPDRWRMQVRVNQAGYSLAQTAPTSGTQMESQSRGTQPTGSNIIRPGDRFIWYRVGASNRANSTVGGAGVQSETIEAQQETPS